MEKKAGGGAFAFTASMRFEHRIVHQWTAELAADAKKPQVNGAATSRALSN